MESEYPPFSQFSVKFVFLFPPGAEHSGGLHLVPRLPDPEPQISNNAAMSLPYLDHAASRSIIRVALAALVSLLSLIDGKLLKEFPDEVDTPLDVPAKARFAKYRGLKSFRTSTWDPKESLPSEYAKIFAFDNFSRTQKHVLAKVIDIDEGSANSCAPIGLYVRLHIKQVPIDVASKLSLLSEKVPIIACGLLQHESKMSVLHFSVKKHDSYDLPIKSKETLVFHVGFRQFVARPLFSSDSITGNKHKMERFLHPGRFSIASIYAPICFSPLPVIILKALPGEAPAIAAVGSLRSVDPDRIVLKKIILTGYPQRVSKVKAIVRFMFHRPEDVRWFKPVEVWSKRGRRGRVKEPVGTHGAMKCIFNGVLQQHDTVCMSLYKRAYPKWTEERFPV